MEFLTVAGRNSHLQCEGREVKLPVQKPSSLTMIVATVYLHSGAAQIVESVPNQLLLWISSLSCGRGLTHMVAKY